MTDDRAALAAEIRGLREARGHATDNALLAADRLERALADGSVSPSPPLDGMLADLRAALARDERGRLGGKSAEAARFILDAIVRELERR
ncbi:MAG: hypothetical protein MUC54_06990 [Chloroflexi bacterium]|nr:hypothetical protein [Chloroflexota bacterium]